MLNDRSALPFLLGFGVTSLLRDVAKPRAAQYGAAQGSALINARGDP